MLKVFSVTSLLVIGSLAFAADKNNKDIAAKYVPGSKLVKEDGSDYDFRTPKNTIVEVELNNDGTIDEASGDLAHEGDVFNPGSNQLSLEAAVAALKKAGKMPTGDWSYEKSLLRGWVYEFEGNENGTKMDYVVSAVDGKLLKDSKD